MRSSLLKYAALSGAICLCANKVDAQAKQEYCFFQKILMKIADIDSLPQKAEIKNYKAANDKTKMQYWQNFCKNFDKESFEVSTTGNTLEKMFNKKTFVTEYGSRDTTVNDETPNGNKTTIKEIHGKTVYHGEDVFFSCYYEATNNDHIREHGKNCTHLEKKVWMISRRNGEGITEEKVIATTYRDGVGTPHSYDRKNLLPALGNKENQPIVPEIWTQQKFKLL